MARTPTQKEIAAFVVAHGITDFVSGGRLSLAERNALWKVVSKLGRPAAKAGATGLARLPGTVRFVAMRHPLGAAVALTYVAVKNRKKIAQLAREGYEIVEEVTEPVREEIVERGRQGC
jgi:hypothetical protein